MKLLEYSISSRKYFIFIFMMGKNIHSVCSVLAMFGRFYVLISSTYSYETQRVKAKKRTIIVVIDPITVELLTESAS